MHFDVVIRAPSLIMISTAVGVEFGWIVLPALRRVVDTLGVPFPHATDSVGLEEAEPAQVVDTTSVLGACIFRLRVDPRDPAICSTIYRGVASARHFVWGANILAISLHAGAAREQAPREEEDKRMIVPAHDANLHSQPTAHRA